MADEQGNAIKIAVLEEQTRGLLAQSTTYNIAAQKRFDHLEAKVDELIAVMNRGKGAYAASMALAAGLGAAVLVIIDAVLKWVK